MNNDNSNNDNVPSEEQQLMINAAVQGKNIISSSVPGSGKTTTILSIAKALPNKKVLQLTYNSKLKSEVRVKIAEKKLNNIEVHTYHSLNRKYYNGSYDDFSIIDTLKTNTSLDISQNYYFDVIVIDEAQDMTDNYYYLVRKFVFDTKRKYQLIIVGDTRQSVYNFKGANHRYLSEAQKFWPEYPFIELSLRTSYRLTPEMADFINKCMIGEDLIKTIKPSNGKVEYIAEPRFHQRKNKDEDPTYKLIKEIKSYIFSGKYTESDIMIICPSVKDRTLTETTSPINLLANKLSKAGINIYKTNDDERFDEKYSVSKICICSMHSSKGLERPVIILYGFCREYFSFYGKDFDPMVCPSTLYVAATRASQKLIIYQNGETPPFMKGNISEIANVKGNIGQKMRAMTEEIRPIAITKIIRFLPTDVLYELNTLINQLFVKIDRPINNIELKSEIEIFNPINNRKTIEQVSDLNGIAIVSRYQFETIEDNFSYHYDGNRFIKVEKKYPDNMAHYLKQANILWAHSENLIYRLNQIKTYDWLDGDDGVKWDKLKQNFDLIDQHNIHKSEVIYEYPIMNANMLFGYKKGDGRIMYINGIIDAYVNDTIFEFKCTNELTIENKLQLIFYSWMMHYIHKKDFTCILLNLKNGEAYKLMNNNKLINDICVKIINSKLNCDYKDNENREFGLFVKMIELKPQLNNSFIQ
jgi:thymidine kinase